MLTLLEKARKTGKETTIGVLKNNPARKLYLRLGFKIIDSNEYKHFMRFCDRVESPDAETVTE